MITILTLKYRDYLVCFVMIAQSTPQNHKFRNESNGARRNEAERQLRINIRD